MAQSTLHSHAETGAGLAGFLKARWPTAVGLLTLVFFAVVTRLLQLSPDFVMGYMAWFVYGMTLIYVAWGSARGELRSRGALLTQSFAVLGFGAVALVALQVDLRLGALLMGATWLGHGLWDAYHFWRNRVLPRAWTEYCGVADLLVGVSFFLGFIP